MNQNDLYDMLLTRKTPGKEAPEILIRCGTEDRYRIGEVAVFLQRFLDSMHVENALVLEPGTHDWPYWNRALPLLARDAAMRLAIP